MPAAAPCPACLPRPAIAAALVGLAVVAHVYGLGSLNLPRNGDEMIYAQITRCTAASGRWLPLRSDMPTMVNTKPPLLFWQGILSTEWGREWSLIALRWPSVAWTLLTAALTGLLAWKIRGRDVAAGLLAAAVYLLFLSTYRYGRPFLTNAPETFWVTLCFFGLLWWRPRSFGSALAVPTLVGIVAGLALLTKSFAQLLPIGTALASWHLIECRRADGSFDWRAWWCRVVPGLAWTAALALGIFAVWFLLDPDPAAIWREFVVKENIGKLRAGRPDYLREVVWGRFNVFGYALTWLLNAGILAAPVAGTFLMGWRHRRSASRDEGLLWILVATWFLVFLLPTQRSGRYLLEVMPAVAVLVVIHWERLWPSAWFATLGMAGAGAILVGLASATLVATSGSDTLPLMHWAILATTAALVGVAAMFRPAREAGAVAAAAGVWIALSSFLHAFDPPRGGFPPAVAAAAAGRVVWVRENFFAAAEDRRFLLPGADVRGYDERPAIPPGDLELVSRDLDEPAPDGAIGSRLTLRSRQEKRMLRELLRGRLASILLCREWLVAQPSTTDAAAAAAAAAARCRFSGTGLNFLVSGESRKTAEGRTLRQKY